MYRIEVLEDQLMETATGRKIRNIIEEQIEEAMMLVNHNRAVMLVWHRNHGPEFISNTVRSGVEEDVEVPEEVKGVKLTSLLRRMAAILQEHGSPALKKAIGEHSLMVLNWAQRCNSLKAVFAEIKELDKNINLGAN